MVDIAALQPRVAAGRLGKLRRFAWRNPVMVFALLLFAAMILVSAFAPLITSFDPVQIDPGNRLKSPSWEHLFGTDAFGRDVFTRTLYGGRVSLAVGAAVAILTTVIGLTIGMLSGYLRAIDPMVMRVMDGIMAIPGVLLAIAIMSVTKASIGTVIFAITVAEVPRMVRVVRSAVLTIREQPYIDAAIATGTRLHRLLLKHIMPNALAPVIVQATFVFASAVIIEAYLSFLGAGTPPEIPSWGNIMAEGRSLALLAIWVILFPGLFLGLMVLATNLLGDSLRDVLDPRMRGRK
ncbi:MAG: transporter permease [Alphaproteobacteria bacterium]|jgi:peptide/nickel transport system permease protein|nr:transporter permease [Alphaproteobacteria bacterium]